jgi:porin
MNGGLVINPVLARTLPYSAWGAGFVVRADNEPLFTFTVLDALSTPTRTGLGTLFENGAVLNAELRVPYTLAGAPGHQLFGATWSSRRYSPLEPSPYLLLPSTTVPLNEQSGSWAVYYNFDQYLFLDPCVPCRGWGIFGRAGLSDAGPNLVHWFVSGGFGGNSLLRGRENDTFGIGYYYMNLSNAGLPLAQVPGNDEQGIEVFYNMALTPWFHVTPDLQWVRPGGAAREAVILGVRAKIDF